MNLPQLFDRLRRLDREQRVLREALAANPTAGRYARALAAREHESAALLATQRDMERGALQ